MHKCTLGGFVLSNWCFSGSIGLIWETIKPVSLYDLLLKKKLSEQFTFSEISLMKKLFFFDFISMGGLKRDRWTAKYFYPIYRFFGFITLAFAYRPLVYNFLDQKKARWIATFILPIYTVVLFIMQIYGVVYSNYKVEGQLTSSYFTSKNNYDDELTEETDFVQFVSLPSKVIDKPYMRIYFGFNGFMEDTIIAHDSVLASKKDRRGYSRKTARSFSFNGLRLSLSNSYLVILSSYFSRLKAYFFFIIYNSALPKSLAIFCFSKAKFRFC